MIDKNMTSILVSCIQIVKVYEVRWTLSSTIYLNFTSVIQAGNVYSIMELSL